jgi:hypothetical protein
VPAGTAASAAVTGPEAPARLSTGEARYQPGSQDQSPTEPGCERAFLPSNELTADDIQWMTAGRGIIHRELAFRDERADTLQLWVNPPGELKMAGTRHQDLRVAGRPVIERHGIRIDLMCRLCRAGSLTL